MNQEMKIIPTPIISCFNIFKPKKVAFQAKTCSFVYFPENGPVKVKVISRKLSLNNKTL